MNESDEPSKWLELSADPDSSKEDCSLQTFKTRWKSQYGHHDSSSDDTSCSGLSQYSLPRSSATRNSLRSFKSSVEGASCLSEYNLSQNVTNLSEYDFRYSLQSDLSSQTLPLNQIDLTSGSLRITSLTSGSLKPDSLSSGSRRQTSLTSGSLRSDSLTSGSLKPELCQTFLDSEPSEYSLNRNSTEKLARDKTNGSICIKSLSLASDQSPAERNKIPNPPRNSSSKKKRRSLQSIAIKNHSDKYREKKLSFFQEKLIEEQRLYEEAEKRRSLSQSKSPNCVEVSHGNQVNSSNNLASVYVTSDSVTLGQTPFVSDKYTKPQQEDRLSIPKSSANLRQKDKRSRRNLEVESYSKNSSSCSDIDELFKKVKPSSSSKGNFSEFKVSNKSRKSIESCGQNRPRSHRVSSTDFLSNLIQEEAEYQQRIRNTEGTDSKKSKKIEKDLPKSDSNKIISEKLKRKSVSAERIPSERHSSKRNSTSKTHSLEVEPVQRSSSNPNLRKCSSVDPISSVSEQNFVDSQNWKEHLSTQNDPAPRNSLSVQKQDKSDKAVTEVNKVVSKPRISTSEQSSLPRPTQNFRNSSETEQISERLSSGSLFKTPKHNFNQRPSRSNQTKLEQVTVPSDDQLVTVLSELEQTSERLSSGSFLQTQTVKTKPKSSSEHTLDRLSSCTLIRTPSEISSPRNHSSQPNKSVTKISKTDKGLKSTGSESFKNSDIYVKSAATFQETPVESCQDRNSLKPLKTPVRYIVHSDSGSKFNLDSHRVVSDINEFESSKGQRLKGCSPINSPLSKRDTNNFRNRSEVPSVITPEEFKFKLSQNSLDVTPDVYFDEVFDGELSINNQDRDISHEERRSIDFSRRSSRTSRDYSERDSSKANSFPKKPSERSSQTSQISDGLKNLPSSTSNLQPQVDLLSSDSVANRPASNLNQIGDNRVEASYQLSLDQKIKELHKIQHKGSSILSDQSANLQSRLSDLDSQSLSEHRYSESWTQDSVKFHVQSKHQIDNLKTELDIKLSQQDSKRNSVRVTDYNQGDNKRRLTIDLMSEVSNASSESQEIRSEIAEFLSARDIELGNDVQYDSLDKDSEIYRPLTEQKTQLRESQSSEIHQDLLKKFSHFERENFCELPLKLDSEADQFSAQQIENSVSSKTYNRRPESDYSVESLHCNNPKVPQVDKSLTSDINPPITNFDLLTKSENDSNIISGFSNTIDIGLINSIHNPANEIKRLASERISGGLQVNPQVLKQSREEIEVKKNSNMDDNQSQNSTQFEALDSEELDSTLISSPSSNHGNDMKTPDIVDKNKAKEPEEENLTNGNNRQEEDRVQLAIMEISNDFISGNLSSGNLMSEDSDDSSHISDLDTHRRKLTEAQYPETGSGLSDNDWNPYTTESDTNMTPRQNGIFRKENITVMTPRDAPDSLKTHVNQNEDRDQNMNIGINVDSRLSCDSLSKNGATEQLTATKEKLQNGNMDAQSVNNENIEKTPTNETQPEDQNRSAEISSFSPELCSSKFISKEAEKDSVTSSLISEVHLRKQDDSVFTVTSTKDQNEGQEVSSYFPLVSRSFSRGKSESEASTPNISNRSSSVLEFSPLLSSTGLNATHMQQHVNRFNVTLSDVSEMTEPLRESLDFKEMNEIEASTIISDDQTVTADPKEQKKEKTGTPENDQSEHQVSVESRTQDTNAQNPMPEVSKTGKQIAGQTPKKHSNELISESENQQKQTFEDTERDPSHQMTSNLSSTEAFVNTKNNTDQSNKITTNSSRIDAAVTEIDPSNKQTTNQPSTQPPASQVDEYHSNQQKIQLSSVDSLSSIGDILGSNKPVEFKSTNQLREEANSLLETSQTVSDQLPKLNLNSSFSKSMDDLTTKAQYKEEKEKKFGSTDCLDKIHVGRKKSNILAEVENYLANFPSQKIDISPIGSRKTLYRSHSSPSSVRRISQHSKDDQLDSGKSDIGLSNVSRYANLNRSNNAINASDENFQEKENKRETNSQVPFQQNSRTPQDGRGDATETPKSEKLSSTVYMEKMKKENPLDVSTFSLSSLDNSQNENCKQINEDLQEIQKNLAKDQAEDASKSMSSDSNYHSCYTAPPGQSDSGSRDTTTNPKSVLSPKDNLTSSDESADIVPSTTSSTPERQRRLMWDYGADIGYDETGLFIGGEQSHPTDDRLSYTSDSRIGQRNSYDNRSLTSIGRPSNERYLNRDQIQMNAARRISYGSEGEETGASTSSGHADGNISDKAESEVTLTEQDIDAEPTQDVNFENDNLLQTLNQKHNVINMIESLRAQRQALEESFRYPGMTIPCYQPVLNRSQTTNEPVDIVTDLANQMEHVIRMGNSPGRVENCLSKVINQEQELREQIFRRICSDSSFSDSSFALDESATNLNHAMDEVKRRLDLSNITSTESNKQPIVPRLDLSGLDVKESRKSDFSRRPFMPPLDLSRKSSGSSKKDSLLSSQYEKRYSQGLDYGTPKKHVVQCYPVYGFKKDGDNSEKKGEENKYEAGPLRQGPPVRSTDPEGSWPEEGHVSNVARDYETLGDSREYTDRSSVVDSRYTSISRLDSSLTNVSEQSSSEMIAEDLYEPKSTTDRRAASSPAGRLDLSLTNVSGQSSSEMIAEGLNEPKSTTDRRAASSPAGMESSTTNRSLDQSDLLTESGVDTSPSHTDRRIASSPAGGNNDWSFRHPEIPGLVQPVPFKPSTTTTTTTDINKGASEDSRTPLSPTYSSPRDSDQSVPRFKSKFRQYRLASHIHGESDTGSVADSITTMESTHTGSDDARGPDLPRSILGTRSDASLRGGIYSKPASGLVPEQALSTIEERSLQNDKLSGESNRSDQSVGKIPAQDTTDSGLYTMTLRNQTYDSQQKTTMADSNQVVETTYVNMQTTHDSSRNAIGQIRHTQEPDMMGDKSIETSNQGRPDDGRRSPFDDKYRAVNIQQQSQRSRSPSFEGSRMEMSGRQLHSTKSKSDTAFGTTGQSSLIDSQNPVIPLERTQRKTSDYQYPAPRTQDRVMSPVTRDRTQSPVTRDRTQSPVTRDRTQSPVTRDRTQDRSLSPVTRDTTRQSHTPVVVDMRLDDRNSRQHQQVIAMDTQQSYYEEVSLPYDYPRSHGSMDTRQQYIEEQNKRNQRRSPVPMETRQEVVSSRIDRERYIEETYSRGNTQKQSREDNPVQPRITQTEKIDHTVSHSNTGTTDDVIMKSRKNERRKQSERNRPQYGHDSTSEEEYLRGLEKSPRGARDQHLRQSLEAEISITPPQDLTTMWPKYSEIYPSEAESQINPTQAEVFSDLVNHPTRHLIYKYFNEREKSRQMIEDRVAKERESRHQQSVRSDKYRQSDEPIPSSSFEQMNASYGEILEALAAERAKRLRRETKAKSMSRSAQKSGKSEKQKSQKVVPVPMMDSQDTLYSIPEDQSYDTLAATSNSQSQDSRDIESAITDPMSTLKHKIRQQREKIEKERRRELKRMEKLWKLEQLLKAKNSGLIGNFVLENNLNTISSTSTAASISESQDALSLDSTLTLSSHTELSDDISTTVKDSSYEVHKAKLNRSRQHAKDRYEAALHQLLSSGSSETITEGEDTPNWAKKEDKRKRADKPKETLRVKTVKRPERGTEREKTTKSKEKGRKLIETRTKSQQSSPYKVKDRKLKSPKKPESFEISPVKWNHESTRVSSPGKKTSKSAALLKGLSKNISPVKKSSKSTHTSREPMTFHHDDTYSRTRSVSPDRRLRSRGVQTSPKFRSRSCSPQFNETHFISASGSKKKARHGSKGVYLSQLYSPELQENRSPKHRRSKHRAKPKPVPPPIAWYVSVENTTKRPEPLQERVPESQTASPTRPRAVWTIDNDYLNSPELKEETPEVTPRDVRSSEIIIDGELFKKPYAITLQEALLRHKKDFISKSRERQKRIALATEHRQMQDYLQMERDRIFGDRKRKGKKIEYPEYKDTVYVRPRKKLFTKKEMKEITARWYRNLPEVKYRERMEKRRQQYQINRLKAMVFNRKVQNTVLRRAGVIV